MERTRLITVALIILSIFTALSGKGIFGLSTNETLAICLIGAGVHLLSWACSHHRITYAFSPLISFFILACILLVTKSGGNLSAAIPTPGSFVDLIDAIRSGISEMKSETSPFNGSTNILLVAMLGMWAVAEIAETTSQRLHLATPTLGIYMLVVALLNSFYFLSIVVLCAAGLFYMFSYHRNYEKARSHSVDISSESKISNLITYSSIGSVIIILSLILALPATNLPSLAPENPFDFLNPDPKTEVTPLVGMRELLQSDTNEVMFEAKTTQAQYWRLAVLDTFTDEVWQTSTEDEAAPEEIPENVEVQQLEAEIEMKELARKYLPTMYSTLDVSTENAKFVQKSVVLADGEVDRYNLIATVPPKELTLDQIAISSDPPPKSVESSLLFPQDFDQEIIELSRSIVRDKSSIYEQVISLRNFFLDGSFTYDLTANYSDEERPMKAFLEQRRGFCEQFAATFAAMARSVGIPARVVVGFSPGDADGSGNFTVREKQAHSWVEVYLSNFGWLTVEPTPAGNQPGQAPTNIGSAVTTTTTIAQSTSVPQSTSSPTTTNAQNIEDPATESSSSLAPTLIVIILSMGAVVFFIRRALIKRDTERYVYSIYKEISRKALDKNPPIDLTIEELREKVPQANKNIHIFLDNLNDISYKPNSKVSRESLRKSAEKARSEKL